MLGHIDLSGPLGLGRRNVLATLSESGHLAVLRHAVLRMVREEIGKAVINDAGQAEVRPVHTDNGWRLDRERKGCPSVGVVELWCVVSVALQHLVHPEAAYYDKNTAMRVMRELDGDWWGGIDPATRRWYPHMSKVRSWLEPRVERIVLQIKDELDRGGDVI